MTQAGGLTSGFAVHLVFLVIGACTEWHGHDSLSPRCLQVRHVFYIFVLATNAAYVNSPGREVGLVLVYLCFWQQLPKSCKPDRIGL